ncbi:Transporter LysE family [Salmonella enterica subsp. enterica]|uniref:Transporter LysE family n=1 Tax=Salmonella enterica I TaxID=59201 RepID=A0A3S4HXD6_SALET|nr:Transporter LysE family [Salmonella enterica subsp. enterica]
MGAAYILWLAWKIATSPAADENARPKPVGFWVSFGLQFVNVKIILYGITALSTFVFTANAGAELGHRRQYIAGIDRHVR